MAISEDTAALVAAQLTVAYSARVGHVGGTNARQEATERTLQTYLAFRELVRERDISHPDDPSAPSEP